MQLATTIQTNKLLPVTLGLGVLVLQIAVIVFTVWFLPTRLASKRFGLGLFIGAVPTTWFGYSVAAMLLDGLIGNDVPGIGYLLLGFVSGLVGLAVFFSQRNRATQ